MDIMTILSIALQVIGGATILLRMVAPLTKTTKDDQLLGILKKILKAVSLNLDDGTVVIKTK